MKTTKLVSVAFFFLVFGATFFCSKNSNGWWSITDKNGSMSEVTIADVNQSNGVIHVVNTVLLPKS